MGPRERFIEMGPESLTDSELIAILLRTGTKEKNVLELSKFIIDEMQGIQNLFNSRAHDLMKIKGLGKAKATTLGAVLELSKRYYKNFLQSRNWQFSSPEDIFHFLKSSVKHDGSEKFCSLFLDSHGRLIEFKEMFRGNTHCSPVFAGEIIKKALNVNCVSIIIAHNHPSGSTLPSREDVSITRKVSDACSLVDITLLDHIIFTTTSYYSMSEKGEL